MNKTEWNPDPDSLRNNFTETDVSELALEQPAPVLDQLAQKVDLPRDIMDAEAVISKVVEVAENNSTIERILERKHEVKDIAAVNIEQAQHINKLGQLIDSKKEEIENSYTTLVTSRNSAPKKGLKRLLNDTSLYGYAIRYGFISGVLALITAIVLVVLFT